MPLISEGLRKNDLQYLVGNKIHFDEFDSKMGDAQDIITISFKVKQRMPAEDLNMFIENGYDWVLDADVSSGEFDDGEYLVFVEMPRRSKIFENIFELLEDMTHLTDIKRNEWKFKWFKQKEYYPFDKENVIGIIPDSPKKYKEFVEQYQDVDNEQKQLNDDLNTIKKLSGVI